MCELDKNLKFCTCIAEKKVIHNQNNRRNKKLKAEKSNQYLWSLSRFVSRFEPMMEGMLNMPSHQLNDLITNEIVLENLNLKDKNCFDFEYIPFEGDSLSIRFDGDEKRSHLYDFLSFIYENNAWRVGMHDGFSTTTELLQKGIIEMIENDFDKPTY